MDLVSKLDSIIQDVGPWGYLVLGASAMIEYIFPLFPGDSVTLLGGVYAARGDKPWLLVLAVVTLGSVVGSLCDYWLGLRLGRRLEAGRSIHIRGIGTEQLLRLRLKMAKRGNLLLLVNRFLPGIRPFLFVAAGAARMPIGRVLFFGALSAILWNGAILGIGVAVGGNVEKVVGVAHRYQQGMVALLVALALFFGGRFLWRRWRKS